MGDGLLELVERAEIGDLDSEGLFGFYGSHSQFHGCLCFGCENSLSASFVAKLEALSRRGKKEERIFAWTQDYFFLFYSFFISVIQIV